MILNIPSIKLNKNPFEINIFVMKKGTTMNMPIANAKVIENETLPQSEDIKRVIKEMLG